MRQFRRRFRRIVRNAFCLLLATALVTSSLSAGGIAVHASGEERTFDIGVNPDSVTATLDDKGLLTVSGSGAIRDFTPETAPFLGCGVSGVKIGPDISVIGAYTFYNCSNLRGVITLPERIVSIGDCAFSGINREWAPKPDLVENQFAESMVTRKREPDSAASQLPEEDGADSGTESVPEENESRFIIEKITQQDVGREIFFSDAAGAFVCSEANESFRAAMLEQGSREADRLLSASFDCGEGISSTEDVLTRNVAVVDGFVTLPPLMPDFSPPAKSELTVSSFRGWTEYRDEPDVVRPAGSRFPVTDQKQLYFIAAWKQEILLRILGESGDGVTVFSVPDTEGYLYTDFQWQFCEPGEGELPQDQELLLWQDVPGAVEQTYVRENEPGDDRRLFRCVVTAEKKQSFVAALFSAPQVEDIALAGVYGTSERIAGEGEIVFEPGTCGGVIGGNMDPIPAGENGTAAAPECGYLVTSQPAEPVVFCGWETDGGDHVDPGDLVPGGTVLTAKWKTPAMVVYVSTSNSNSAAGTESNPCSMARGFDLLGANNTAACPASDPEAMYRNIMVLTENLTAPQNWSVSSGSKGKNPTVLNYPFTLTSYAPGVTSGPLRTVTLNGQGVFFYAATRLENLQASGAVICGNGRRLTVSSGVTFSSTNVTVCGAASNDVITAETTDLRLFGGTYETVLGGGNKKALTGNTRVLIGGSASVTGSVYGGGDRANGTTSGSATVIIAGGTVSGSVYGGGNSAPVGSGATVLVYGGTVTGSVFGGGNAGQVTGNSTVCVSGGSMANVYGGGEQGNITGNSTLTVGGDAQVSGSAFGGGMGQTGGQNGSVSGTTGVTVAGQCQISGSVYGGCRNGSVNGTGNCEITVTGGTVSGSVFGGGLSGNTAGNVVLIVSGGSIEENIYGGGSSGDLSGNSSVAMSGGAVTHIFGGGLSGSVGGSAAVALSQGSVGGSVYGGGQLGGVGGGTSVAVSGGAVAGNLFGGSMGEAGNSATGAVQGNTGVTVTGGELGTYEGASGGAFDQNTGNVFGGGQYAAVIAGTGTDGSSAVLIEISAASGERPPIPGSVYGGGSEAPVAGNSSVTLSAGQVGGHLYGGGLGVNSSSGSTEVTVNAGSVGRNVYGGGAQGRVLGGASVTVQGGSVGGSVFGAGEGNENAASPLDAGRVTGQTSVTVSGGNVTGNVYGGGDRGLVGSGSDVENPPAVPDGGTSVTVSGGEMNNVFGGGSGSGGDPRFGSIFGDTFVAVSGGSVNNVFGGSNYAYVVGSTEVTVRAGASAVTVRGSLFGGGNLQQNPEDVVFDESSYLVYGNSSVVLDGSAPGVNISGGILGSGNLTLVRGDTRAVTVRNFTGSLAALQRATLATVTDSSVTLRGETDSTVEGSKLFSVTKLGELRVKNSTLTLLSSVRELSSLTSTDSGTQSTLQLAPGMQMKIGPAVGYGTVTGIFWLEMAQAARQGEGVRIDADTLTPWGDGVTDTGAFLRKDSALNADPADSTKKLEMVSGTIPGSHNFWRLGGTTATIPETLAAARNQSGGRASVSASVEIPTSTENTVYLITSVRRTEGDFSLILPEERSGETVLPAFGEGQSADDTFALTVRTTGTTGWSGAAWSACALTGLPQGQSAWPSGVENLWKDGDLWPVGAGLGQPGELTFTLYYESGYERFSGGKMEIVFKEYPALGDRDDSTVLNTVVVELTLEGDSSGSSQSAVIAGGRTFSGTGSASPVTVAPFGAVTAGFLTEYYPSETGAGNISLHLMSDTEGVVSPVNFPEGTCVIMADRSAGSRYRYYYYRSAGEQALGLSALTSLGGEGSVTYPGPTDISVKNTEDLLFAVDFSDVDDGDVLPGGSYFLALTHTAAEQPGSGARANFSVAEVRSASLSLAKNEALSDDTVWAVTLTSSIPPEDTRYADGVSIHLSITGKDDKKVGFPDAGHISGNAENILRDRDGDLSFTLPANVSGTVVLDLSAVPESMMAAGDYTVSASMGPRAGLQMSSDQGAPVSAGSTLSCRLSRAVRQERSLSVSLAEGSQRIVDVTEAAGSLGFALSYANLQQGDRLRVELLRKTGKTPHEESYTAYSAEGWTFSQLPETISGTGGSLTLTVPHMAAEGTYRVLFRIEDSSGEETARELYNFIVKGSRQGSQQ